jgi:hypothetical protein
MFENLAQSIKEKWRFIQARKDEQPVPVSAKLTFTWQ